VLDGIGMIQACFFEELLDVVLRQSYPVLVVAHDLCGVFDAGVAHPLVDATIDIGCGLLAALFASLLVGLGALLSTLDGDAGQSFPAADRGWLKSHHLGTCSMMGGNATPSFGGALGGIGQRVEGS
jgi:hypothetical protein